MIDVARARDETPGCRSVAHLNNAGAALQPKPVLDAVLSHLGLEARIGGYEAADRNAEAVERPYRALAELLNCSAAEMAVMESATRAWQAAFLSVALEPGDRVLTSAAEYGSNYLQMLHSAARRGVSVEVVPDDESGQVSVDALADALDERVKLVAVTHVPTGGGLVNPAPAVGRLARAAGALYLLDACQSIGQVPIDVDEVGCDFLAATSRKYLRGPRGVGLLYARATTAGQLEPALPDLRSATWEAADRYAFRPDARRFEAWEMPMAAKIGLGVAVDYALAWGLPDIWDRVRRLADELRHRLAELPGVAVHDLGVERCGIVTFSVRRRDPEEVRRSLGAAGVNVSVAEAGSARLDFDRRHLAAVVRASVHYYNDDADLDRCCRAVAALA
ncbi:MAG TPA: aminotransferase class V-fold PLP-dependent enzyme [Acidimicrobiales bacterium]|nr:aminotransferase class V-fold PLP-dependent enzyme [Acidimicrobiales bacterium]